MELVDAKIYIELIGSSPGAPVVLVHGLGGTGKSWGEIPAALAVKRSVGTVDLRGCGRSERGQGPISLAQMAEDVANVVRRVWGRRCHLIGHSLGGVVVQDLLTAQPDVCAAAILVSTSSVVGEKAAESWRRLADVVEKHGLGENGSQRAFSAPFAAAHPDVVAEHSRISAETDPSVYSAQARAASSYDYGSRLTRVKNPVLVLQGLADRLTSPGGAVILSRTLPNATLEMIEGVGHNLHIEMGARFVDLALDFLALHEDAALS